MNGRELAPEVVRQVTVPMPAWGCELVAVETDDGRRYFPLRALVAVVTPGLTVRYQVDRIREHAALRRLCGSLPVLTAGGRQWTWCLEERGVGFWLGTLQEGRIRPELRERIVDFQAELVAAADRLLRHGDAEPSMADVQETLRRIRAQLATHDGEIAGLARFVRILERRIGQVDGGATVPPSDS